MIEFVGYGILLAIGFHLGGKISKKLGLGKLDKTTGELGKGEGINTRKYVSKIHGVN